MIAVHIDEVQDKLTVKYVLVCFRLRVQRAHLFKSVIFLCMFSHLKNAFTS